MEEAQINIRCSKVVAERLKAITKAERIKSGNLLEKLLDCYQDSIRILSADTGMAETGIAETVKMLESRLLALESRFEGLGAVGEVSQPEVENVAVVADLKPSVAADAGAETVEPVAVETVEAGAVKKQKLTDDELDVLVSKYLAEANGVASDAIKAMQRDGCSCQRNRFFASKKRLQEKAVNDGQT